MSHNVEQIVNHYETCSLMYFACNSNENSYLCLVENSDTNLDLDPERLLNELNICNMKCWCCCALSNDALFAGIGS